MNEQASSPDKIVLPALLRHARVTYGTAMRRALEDAGYEDIPRNGMYVIGSLALGDGGVPLTELVRQLQTSKQAASQLVDMLVMRGYLDRAVDPEDRRKLSVTLTERGCDAAAVQIRAREAIDARLLETVGPESIAHTRRTLAALIELRAREAPED